MRNGLNPPLVGTTQLFVDCAVGGRPDGAAMDEEGCYWSCGILAGRINRFSPSGSLVQYVELPVTRPTMLCFGGSSLRTLYVTSLREGLSESELSRSPLAGAVFSFEPGVAGTTSALFKG